VEKIVIEIVIEIAIEICMEQTRGYFNVGLTGSTMPIFVIEIVIQFFRTSEKF